MLSPDAGLPVTEVADLTGSPEMLDGRVKTLHPVIHGGILARRDLDSHRAEIDAHGIQTIDVVAGNLYPFVDTVNADGVTLQDALENIDIGGPTMIRSAAKNFPAVLVIVDPSDYGWIAERIADSGLDPDPFTMDERRGTRPQGIPARRPLRHRRLPLPHRRLRRHLLA